MRNRKKVFHTFSQRNFILSQHENVLTVTWDSNEKGAKCASEQDTDTDQNFISNQLLSTNWIFVVTRHFCNMSKVLLSLHESSRVFWSSSHPFVHLSTFVINILCCYFHLSPDSYYIEFHCCRYVSDIDNMKLRPDNRAKIVSQKNIDNFYER